MAYDRFLIAPFNTGLQTDLRPWLILEDAFTKLTNAYVFRGRIRKRFGSYLMGTGNPIGTQQLLSRLRINLGNTTASNFTGTVPGDIFKIGQMFSIGNEIFTVVVDGTPGVMLDTGTSTVHTYNTTNGAVVITGANVIVPTPVFFYPAEPVMGITNYEFGPVNNQPSYAFDTQFAYTWNGASWVRSGSGTTPEWHGDNLNFFWVANWRGITANVVVMFVTNFNATVPTPAGTDDPIWTFDGTTWATYQPIFLTAGNFVRTARIIVPFKDRLVFLNTIESNSGGTVNSAYPNRARFSHNGSPFSVNAWLEPNQDITGNFGDGAGFIDASTEEQIISAEFIKDRLMVYFERSTWELAYTGNQVLPFVWQKLNTELGAESTFSVVPFDKVVLGIANVGVHACNGSNVERIDNKIPDSIFKIKNKNEGVERVAGVRDYYTEMVYWTFPSDNQNSDQVYPNRILVYNYRDNSWAFNDDSITVWGYFEQQTDLLWQNATLPWQEANFTWDSGIIQAQFRQIIAGNQEGFIFIIDPDESQNAPALQITNITTTPATTLTIVDHNLSSGDYILINSAQGITGLNGDIFQVAYVDTNTVSIGRAPFTGVYTGGGTAQRVSNINITSKQWNPYVKQGRDVSIAKIDFCVINTADGQVTVDYYPSSTNLSMITAAKATLSSLGNNILETSPYPTIPLESEQERLWHPVYFQTDGEFIQINISFSDAQITTPAIALSDFQLEGIILHTQPTTSRLQ
jgi:hypothetical protein